MALCAGNLCKNAATQLYNYVADTSQTCNMTSSVYNGYPYGGYF